MAQSYSEPPMLKSIKGRLNLQRTDVEFERNQDGTYVIDIKGSNYLVDNCERTKWVRLHDVNLSIDDPSGEEVRGTGSIIDAGYSSKTINVIGVADIDDCEGCPTVITIYLESEDAPDWHINMEIWGFTRDFKWCMDILNGYTEECRSVKNVITKWLLCGKKYLNKCPEYAYRLTGQWEGWEYYNDVQNPTLTLQDEHEDSAFQIMDEKDPRIKRRVKIIKKAHKAMRTWRQHVITRIYALYWQEYVTKRLCAKNGIWREEDKKEFEGEFIIHKRQRP